MLGARVVPPIVVHASRGGSRRSGGDRPRLHRGRDTSSYATTLSVWRSCRLAARVSVLKTGSKGERPQAIPAVAVLVACSTGIQRYQAAPREAEVVPLDSIDVSEFEIVDAIL